MSHQPKHSYEFGSYHLNPAERLLRRNGEVVPLQPKILDLLLVLVEHHGRLLEKDELMKLVWPDAIVEEANLANNISILRKTLNENGERFIETVPKSGYRFVAPVRDAPVVAETAPPARDSSHSIMWLKRRPAQVIALVILLLIGVAGALSFRSASRQPATVGAPIKSIAVLPFKPLNRNPDDEYLGIGIADSVITRLSGAGKLVVRPVSAVSKYTASTQDPLAAGREQQVDAVLDASLWRAGERMRVTARLLNVRDGSSLWTYECEELCTDLFAVQTLIAARVADALAPHLSGVERARLTRHYTENRAAYQLYLKGRYYAEKRTTESYQKATEHYQQALDLDPNYALAWVGLADAYYIDLPPLPARERMPRARAAAMKALAIDETLGEAHTSLARVIWQYDWDWPVAEREFKRSLELDPGSAFTHRIYGYYLASMGRFDESVAELKQAQQLDPLSLVINLDVGQMLYYAGRYDQAMAQFRKAQQMAPNFRETYHRLGLGYCRMGMYPEAVAELDQADTLAKGNPRTISLLGYAYGRWGKRDEAIRKLGELQELSKRRYVTPYEMAVAYTGLGEKDQAFEWLQRSCDEREPLLVYLKVQPVFESLQAEPRFADLLRCVRLAP